MVSRWRFCLWIVIVEAVKNDLDIMAMSTYKVIRTGGQRMLLSFRSGICFWLCLWFFVQVSKDYREPLSVLIFVCYNVILPRLYPSHMSFVLISSRLRRTVAIVGYLCKLNTASCQSLTAQTSAIFPYPWTYITGQFSVL